MNLLKDNLSNGPYLGNCLWAYKVTRSLSFGATSQRVIENDPVGKTRSKKYFGPGHLE